MAKRQPGTPEAKPIRICDYAPADERPTSRRAFLKTSGAASLLFASGIAQAQDYDYDRNRYIDDIFDPNPIPNIRAPSLKPPGGGGTLIGRWARLADMPFPVQEIYPSAYWTSTIADQQATKALRAQRFNIIVSAGGITSVDRGRVLATDQVSIYDPLTDRWEVGPRLGEPRHHLHLVAHNGYLFALGGFTSSNGGWTMVSDAMRLSSPDGRWERMRSLPIAQAEAACVSVAGYIHMVGGRSPIGSQNGQWSDHIDTDRHVAYDSRQDAWFDRAPMMTPRNSMAAVGMRGVIYTFGGRQVTGGNLNVTEAYDPLSDRWQQMRPMPRAQAGLAAAAIGNTVFVFGGEYFAGERGTNSGVFSEVWAYDTSEDRWRSAGLMSRPRHGHGAVALNDAIYVIGGAFQAGGTGTTSVVDRFMVR